MSKGPAKVALPLDRSMYLLHPYNTTLVTSKTSDGKNNIMSVAWIIPVSVNPPLLAMSIRPNRYSYEIIKETKEFVVNIPTFDMAKAITFCGRRTGRQFNKFKETQLTPRKARTVKAPIIEECVAHLECKLWKTIKTGDHDLFLGEILAAYVKAGYFSKTWDVTKYRPAQHTGLEYFTTCSLETIEIKF
jgi:flavin reductase (DIM6/NTAB) family NADH-FMN oxidoreductase RutF